MTGKVSDAVAEKLARESAERNMKDMEEKQKKAQRHRLDYLLKLNDLGFHEQLVLEYGLRAVLPRANLVPIEGNNRLEARKAIEEKIAELSGIQVAVTGLVSANGSPL